MWVQVAQTVEDIRRSSPLLEHFRVHFYVTDRSFSGWLMLPNCMSCPTVLPFSLLSSLFFLFYPVSAFFFPDCLSSYLSFPDCYLVCALNEISLISLRDGTLVDKYEFQEEGADCTWLSHSYVQQEDGSVCVCVYHQYRAVYPDKVRRKKRGGREERERREKRGEKDWAVTTN